MALSDHLRELRARLLRSVLVVVVAFSVALFFYDQLLELVLIPYNDAREQLGAAVETEAVVNDVTGPLLLQLKLCGVVAIVASSPYWLYQIWAFILPGLHPSERKWSRIFAAIAGPLFFAGVATGYYVLPKAIEVLIGFTPEDVTNLVEFGKFFSFITRMLLVFGIAFEIPLFVVMLNLAGVVSGKALGRYRPWIIIGTFVFAAVATPSTDPFSMLFLAVPMLILFGIAEVIARIVDRARGKGGALHRAVGRRRGFAAVTSSRTAELDPFDLPDWVGEGRGRLGHRRGASPGISSPAASPARATRSCPATSSPSTRPTRLRWSTRRSEPGSTRPGSTARCSCSPAMAGPRSRLPARRGPRTRCSTRSPEWPGRSAPTRPTGQYSSGSASHGSGFASRGVNDHP